MKKTIVTVFIILGILCLCVIIWSLVFNNNFAQGIINNVLKIINKIWQNLSGDKTVNLINYFKNDNVGRTSQMWGG